MDFIFVYAMQVGELAGIAVGATVLLNILISGYGWNLFFVPPHIMSYNVIDLYLVFIISIYQILY